MNKDTYTQNTVGRAGRLSALIAFLCMGITCSFAQNTKKNPSSKFFVADLVGETQLDTGEKIEDLTKKSVYTAQGTVLQTKAKSSNALVYSNGSGLYLDPETRMEVKKFIQEPFTPNRNDMDVEPSISRTEVLLTRGTLGLCTSKLVAGSSMAYETNQAIVAVRGAKVVIQASDDQTIVSLFDGEVTVRGGPQDIAGQTLKSGYQAIIKKGAPGQANSIVIQPIPSDQMQALSDKVTMACMARKTVYFEVRDKGKNAGDNSITAFDSPDTSFNAGNNGNGGPGQVLVPIEVIGGNTPTGTEVSPARLP